MKSFILVLFVTLSASLTAGFLLGTHYERSVTIPTIRKAVILWTRPAYEDATYQVEIPLNEIYSREEILTINELSEIAGMELKIECR